MTYSINVKADTASAESDLQSLVSGIGKGPLTIGVRADTDEAEAGVQSLADSVGQLGNSADEVSSQAVSIGSSFRQSFLEATDSGESFSSSIRAGVVGAITTATEKAGGIGQAFSSSFKSSIDSGNSLASSLKSGLGGAFDYAKDKASSLKDNVVQGANSIKSGFEHPIETIKTGLGNALQSAKTKFTDMARSAEDAAASTEEMGESADGASGDMDGLAEATDDAGDAAEKSGSKFEKFGGVLKTIGAGILAATVAVTGFAASSVGVGMGFDSSMSQVAATMGMTMDEMNSDIHTVQLSTGEFTGTLRDFAMEMGSNTSFSATQAGSALNFMALAGYDAETSMQMLPNVLNLAAAGNMELAAASDMVTDAQSALGLSLSETTELVDKMAMASSKSNTSVSQLGSAILTVGGTAKNLAGGTTELSTALGILADNGIKGAEGGTHLRNIILALGSPTDTAAKAMADLGVSAYDADGKMRPLNETFADLNNALSDMSQDERLAAIGDIFNTTDLASANALLDTSAERWEELGNAIDNAGGAAQAMADTQLDNLAGDVTLFQSALEGAQIVLADQLNPTLRQFVQFGTSAISTLSTAFQEGGLSGAMGALGSILSDGLTMVIGMLPTLVDAGMQLLGALGQGILSNLPLLISAASQIIVTLATGIGSALPELVPSVVETLFLVASTLLDNLPLILDAGMQIISGLAQGILAGLPILVSQLPQLILQIVSFLSSSLPLILEQGSQIILSLANGIMSAAPMLIGQLPVIISSIVGFITSNAPLLVQTGVMLIVSLAQGFISSLPALISSAGQLVSAIGDALLNTDWLSVGAQIVTSIWDGIKSIGSSLFSGIGSLFSGGGGDISTEMSAAGTDGAAAFTSSLNSGLSEFSFDSSSLGIDMTGLSSEMESAGTEGADAFTTSLTDGLTSFTFDADSLGLDMSGFTSTMESAGTEGITLFGGAVDAGSSEVAASITTMCDTLTTSTQGAFDNMESTAAESMSSMRSTLVSEATASANAVKNAFESITITIPKPRIPEISVSFTTEGEGEAAVKIPHFSVSYHALGGILTDPTLLGFMGDTAHVGGEAGPEAILPLDSFYEKLEDILLGGTDEDKVAETPPPSGPSETVAESAPAPFAPVINIYVQGNASESAVSDLNSSLYDTVRQLWEEFNQEQRDQMALKNQYSFR